MDIPPLQPHSLHASYQGRCQWHMDRDSLPLVKDPPRTASEHCVHIWMTRNGISLPTGKKPQSTQSIWDARHNGTRYEAGRDSDQWKSGHRGVEQYHVLYILDGEIVSGPQETPSS